MGNAVQYWIILRKYVSSADTGVGMKWIALDIRTTGFFFLMGIHWSPAGAPHKYKTFEQLMLSFLLIWTKSLVALSLISDAMTYTYTNVIITKFSIGF